MVYDQTVLSCLEVFRRVTKVWVRGSLVDGASLHVCQAQEHLVTSNPSLKPCHINHPPVAGQSSWTAFRERASSPFSSMPKSSCPSIRPVYWTTTSHRPCASNLPSPESVFEPLSKVVDIIGLMQSSWSGCGWTVYNHKLTFITIANWRSKFLTWTCWTVTVNPCCCWYTFPW